MNEKTDPTWPEMVAAMRQHLASRIPQMREMTPEELFRFTCAVQEQLRLEQELLRGAP